MEVECETDEDTTRAVSRRNPNNLHKLLFLIVQIKNLILKALLLPPHPDIQSFTNVGHLRGAASSHGRSDEESFGGGFGHMARRSST